MLNEKNNQNPISGIKAEELVDQEGNYVDYIKMSDLFNGKYELFQKTNKRSEKYVKR